MLQKGGSRKVQSLPKPMDLKRQEALRLSIVALRSLGLVNESAELAELSRLDAESETLKCLQNAVDQADWPELLALVSGLTFNSDKDKSDSLEWVFQTWIGHLVEHGKLEEAVSTLQLHVYPQKPLAIPKLCWSLFSPSVSDQTKSLEFLTSRCHYLAPIADDRLEQVLRGAKAFKEFEGESFDMDVLDLVRSILESEGYGELALGWVSKGHGLSSTLRAAKSVADWEHALETSGAYRPQVLRHAVAALAGTTDGVAFIQRHATDDNREELSQLLMNGEPASKRPLTQELTPTPKQIFDWAQKYECMMDDYALGGSHSLCTLVKGSRDQFPQICAQTLVHDNEVWDIALSGCQKLLACGTRSGAIYIWALKESKFVLASQYEGVHTEGVQTLAWRNRTLLSAGADGVFTLIDVDSSTVLLSHSCPDQDEKTDIAAVCWYNDTFFTGGYDGHIIQWDLQGRELWRYSGVRVLSMSIRGSTLTVLSVLIKKRGHLLITMDLDTKVVQRSTIGTRLASLATSSHGSIMHTQPSGLSMLDTDKTMEGPVQESLKIRGSFGGPADKYYASGSEDSCVYVFNTLTQKCVQRLEGHDTAVNTAIWGPGAEFIASAGDDGTVRIWRP